MAGIEICGEPLLKSVMIVILLNMCYFEEIMLTELLSTLENSLYSYQLIYRMLEGFVLHIYRE